MVWRACAISSLQGGVYALLINSFYLARMNRPVTSLLPNLCAWPLPSFCRPSCYGRGLLGLMAPFFLAIFFAICLVASASAQDAAPSPAVPLGAGAEIAAGLNEIGPDAASLNAPAKPALANVTNFMPAEPSAAPLAAEPAAAPDSPAAAAAAAPPGFAELLSEFGRASQRVPSADAAPATVGLPSPLLEGGEVALPPSPDQLQDPAAMAAAAALASVEAQRQAQQNAAREQSFNTALEQLFPLSPAQIRTLMDRLEVTQSASIPPAGGEPIGSIAVETISLEPGTQPPEILMAAGYVTTLTFVDASGQPWPIVDIGIGGQYQATPTEPGTHIVRLSPLTRFGTGNMSVRLEGLATPVIFRLNTQADRLHYRFDARLPGYGPRAEVPLIAGPGVQAGSSVMMAVLENAPPPDAERMRVSGLDSRSLAWRVGERVYLRTPLQLLSPGWAASVSSSDGTNVYDIPPAPVLLLSDGGVLLRARVTAVSGEDELAP